MYAKIFTVLFVKRKNHVLSLQHQNRKTKHQNLTKNDRKIQNFQLLPNSYLTPTFLLPKINPKNEPKMTQLTF